MLLYSLLDFRLFVSDVMRNAATMVKNVLNWSTFQILFLHLLALSLPGSRPAGGREGAWDMLASSMRAFWSIANASPGLVLLAILQVKVSGFLHIVLHSVATTKRIFSLLFWITMGGPQYISAEKHSSHAIRAMVY